MKYGVCTNQPSLCARAAARELMAMPSPDTRCPEPGCGKPLLPAPGSQSARRSSPLLIAGAIALAALAALAAGAYLWQNKNAESDDGSSDIRASSVPADTVPGDTAPAGTAPADDSVTPASAPASSPPASSSPE